MRSCASPERQGLATTLSGPRGCCAIKKEATVAITLKIEATVKVSDNSQLEDEAYATAVAELVRAYPRAVPALSRQEYNSGEHWYTFDVSDAVAA